MAVPRDRRRFFRRFCYFQVKIVAIVVLILGNLPAEFLRTRNNPAESQSLSRQLFTDAVARAAERFFADLGPHIDIVTMRPDLTAHTLDGMSWPKIGQTCDERQEVTAHPYLGRSACRANLVEPAEAKQSASPYLHVLW
jgi:hypothetical protein